MKCPTTFEEIMDLFNSKIAESENLDYKQELGSSARANTEIAKDVSSFANTEGGVILYGIEEKDGIPTRIVWIRARKVKERIEDIVGHHIQPNLESFHIERIANPKDDEEAVFSVCILRSSHTIHMVNNTYYKRHKFKSAPMGHREIMEAISRRGIRDSLLLEIRSNLELAERTSKVISEAQEYRQRDPGRGPLPIFTPFKEDAWKAMISSGLIHTSGINIQKAMEAYSIISDLNHLIDCQKYGHRLIITTLVKENDIQRNVEYGSRILVLMKEKIPILVTLLQNLIPSQEEQ